MRRLFAAVTILAALAGPFAPSAFAVQPDEILSDPALEARARTISGELRCLVCQNQSIDASDAPLARDLRILVRERLQAGDSDDQVVALIVDRYGEFVLLKPRFEAKTLVLWATPVALLLAGALAVLHGMRHRRADHKALTEDEKRRIAELLDAQD
jgi:cytochrome c-type biogenesis protein CcmH